MFSAFQFCCICMNETQLINLYNFDVDDIKFIEKLKFCIPEIMCDVEKLPELICRSCCIDLKKAHMLKESYFKTIKILKDYIAKSIEEKIQENIVEPLQITEETNIIEDNEVDSINPTSTAQNGTNDANLNGFLQSQQDEMYRILTDLGNEQEIKHEVNDDVPDCEQDITEAFVEESAEIIEESTEENLEKSDSFKNDNEEDVTDYLIELSHNDMVEYWNCWNVKRIPSRKRKCKANDSSRFLVKINKNEKGDMSYACKVCTQIFPTLYLLNDHIEDHIKNKSLLCSICKQEFKVLNSYISHVSSHKPVKYLRCPVCSKAFNYKLDLLKHIRSKNDDKSYVCKVCGISFKQDSEHYKKIDSRNYKENCGDQVSIECASCFRDDSPKIHCELSVSNVNGANPQDCKSKDMDVEIVEKNWKKCQKHGEFSKIT